MGREQGGDLLSDEIQREKIEAWATYRGYKLVRWYVDLDVSGREGVRRPEFERMLADARDHRFEVVAVYRLTRFARSVKGAAEAYAALRASGVELVSCTEDIDTTTASGKFMQNMLFAMAEFESERISEEWRNVHASRRARGIAHVARPVTGYRSEGAQIVAVEPVEAAAIRKMFTMRAQGLGYGTIRTRLQDEGYTSRLGRTRFSQSTISGILRNPLYAGLVKLPNGELIDATHEPIVPRELWETVQKTTAHTSRMNRHRASLLTGLLVCSSCGYRMHFERGRRDTTTGFDKAGAYRCPGRQRANGCPNPMHVHAEYVEEYVEQRFLSRLNPKRMPHGGKVRATRQQKEWRGRLAKTRARIEEITRALDALADQRWLKGSLSADEYERQFTRYAEERADLQAAADDLERLVETVRPIERDVLQLWPRLDVDVKRRALRVAIGEIRVLPAPRKGKGQRDLIGQRLEIGWVQ